MKRTMQRGRVYDIDYACRKPCEDEVGTLRGYWNGDIDMWGKRTIVVVPSGALHYFFADEIKHVSRV
jgi:hypothetical protein